MNTEEHRVDWLNVLHFYQPPFQDMEIVRQATEECYLPVSRVLMDRPGAHTVVNINGCLLEFLEKFREGREVMANLKSLLSCGQIEITGTGKFHPVFPLIHMKEKRRQVELQKEALKKYLGTDRMEILFLPELAYGPEEKIIFREYEFRWIIIDEMSLKEKNSEKHYITNKEGDMNILIRDRNMSEALGRCLGRKFNIETPEDFVDYSLRKTAGKGFLVTVSDAEVFGHHQKGRWRLLGDIYNHPSVRAISIENVSEQYGKTHIETRPASWSTTETEISEEIYYPLWHHPGNSLHKYLWQLLDLTVEEVRIHGTDLQNRRADALLSSCPFFWASCRPWWNGIIVENAAQSMYILLSDMEDVSGKLLERAWSLRNRIYKEVSDLNKTGRAREFQEEYFREHNLDRDEAGNAVY